MKKMILLSVAIISLMVFVNAQNPQWLNYTNGDHIFALAEEGNNMWVGTRGGLVKLDKTTGVPAFYNKANSGLPDNFVLSIAIDASGKKWIGTYDGGLTEFDGTNWTTYNTSNSGLPDNAVGSIAIDASGTKWIGTYGGGLAEFDGTNWTTYNISNSGLPDNNVRSIAIDASGTKWIGPEYSGLAAYNENGIPVSIGGNIIIENEVKIYPNPSSSHITIETPVTPHKNTFLTIYNLSGQQLIERQIMEPKTVIDISDLLSGVYFVRVVGGKEVMVGKVVKR